MLKKHPFITTMRFILALLLLITFTSFNLALAPDPMGLIDQYIEAIGGRKKLLSVQNVQEKVISKTNEIETTTELLLVIPDKYYLHMEVNGNSSICLKNGNRGYYIFGNDTSALSREEIGSMRDDNYLYPFLYYKKWGYKLEWLGEKEIDGKESIGIIVNRPIQGPIELFFDKKTKLLSQTYSSQLGLRITYEEYQKQKGILHPRVFTSENRGMGTMRSESIELDFNVSFAPNMFDL